MSGIGRLLSGAVDFLGEIGGLFFPDDPFCPYCGASCGGPGVHVLCPACYDRLGVLPRWRPLPLEGDGLEEVAALGAYEGPLRQAVHRLKFRADRRLGLALGYLMGALTLGAPGARRADAVVPLPLHGERAWRRGFNQAEVLAWGTARMLGRPVWDKALLRTRATQQQARLGEDERRDNVQGAFAASPGTPIAGRQLLLVDDVVTTGATLRAAAGALAAAGAAEVYAVVVAAQERVRGRKKIQRCAAGDPDGRGRWEG